MRPRGGGSNPAEAVLERSLTRTHKYLLAFFVALMVVGGVVRMYNAGLFGRDFGAKTADFKKLPERLVSVHVTGAVAKPGVYELEPGARVIDAVEAAGGFTAAADRDTINLADFAEDGGRVDVQEGSGEAASAERGGSASAEKKPRASAKKRQPTARVNINTANSAQLMTLPGVGKVTAERIVETRGKMGGFKAEQDLLLVKGIGQKKFLKMEAWITTGRD